jgi:hypothetical protein
MTERGNVLCAGTFRVSDYRRNMPVVVKLQAMWRAIANGSLPDPKEVTIACRDLEFDHNPALMVRDYDLDAGDFMPPQNDPDYIDARIGADHDFKTFGRKPGAEKTVTTRGSDIGEAAHGRAVVDSEKLHAAAMASKAGNYKEVAAILATVRSRAKKPKRKIPSRPFPKQQRKMRSA